MIREGREGREGRESGGGLEYVIRNAGVANIGSISGFFLKMKG
jgi:hypothetical protein